MNRRKAKKAIKKKYHIEKWPCKADPRQVEKCIKDVCKFFDTVLVPIIHDCRPVLPTEFQWDIEKMEVDDATTNI